MNRIPSFLAVAALFAGTSLHAQAPVRSATNGLVVGVSLNGSSIKMDDSEFGDAPTESGGGIDLRLGYNFSPRFGIFLDAAGASISDDEGGYALGQADLGARYTFANAARAFVPYVELAYTGLSAQDDFEGEDVELQGTGFSGAAGLNYFFTPRVAMDVNFRYTAGEFNTLRIGGESMSSDDGIGVNTGRFNIGVNWYPMAVR